MISPCSHEEADSRLFLHIAEAYSLGHRSFIVRGADTDIVVLAVALASKLTELNTLWIAFGTGKTFRYIPAHIYAEQLGNLKATALPMFHALTGCDTTCDFHGIGKKTAWEACMEFPEVTEALVELASPAHEVTQDQMALLQRLVILMYDRKTQIVEVNIIPLKLVNDKFYIV